MITQLLSTFSLFFIVLSSFWFIRCRTLRYLRYLQQEEYDPKRFVSWFFRHRAFDKKGSPLAFIAWGIAEVVGSSIPLNILMRIAVAVGLSVIAALEIDPRKQGKITLKLTERASRIYRVALGIALITAVVSLALLPPWLALLCIFQFTPAYLIASTWFLLPQEKRLQQQLAAEAREILKRASPFVIGITGSYGKTSTKNILGQILQVAVRPTFWPKKSINTVMGNTREIRTSLKKGHRYAIFEMGAYRRGSIKKLCNLTPPHAAIITSIGTAHLERFGTQENIYHAKSEIAQALPETGILICNGDDPGARRVSREYPTHTTLCYGFDLSQGPLDCLISQGESTDKGTAFTLIWQGITYEGFTPLHGKPNLSNIAAAFTFACTQGAHPEYLLAVIRTLEPVDNRLHITKHDGITTLHDAYNSNPIGFNAALDLMKSLNGERRILMTPGMIELGHMQESENEKLGRTAAPLCDIAIVVGKTNKKPLVAGLKAGGLTSEQVLTCPTRDHAFKVLKSLQRSGDVILIENDLTDLYEAQETF
jgi:UDP-N-acetylmuramoyl-tripeptide--D-alanyl-D-alanine ligase